MHKRLQSNHYITEQSSIKSILPIVVYFLPSMNGFVADGKRKIRKSSVVVDAEWCVASRRDVRVPDSRSLYLGCPGPGPFLVGNRWTSKLCEGSIVDESLADFDRFSRPPPSPFLIGMGCFMPATTIMTHKTTRAHPSVHRISCAAN